MTLKPILFAATVAAGALFSVNSQATAISNQLADSYGDTSHKNPSWQELESNPLFDGFGVYWRVGGADWGREDIQAGDSLQFKIDVHKDNIGTHYADLAKLWVDWDQDGIFNEIGANKEVNDVFMFDLQVLLQTDGSHSGDKDVSYLSDAITLADTFVGELNFRARVTCSASVADGFHDLSDWGNGDESIYNEAFLSTGELWQGETEDWTVSVNPVPEPTTMLLFGTGLIGLAGVSRRKKK